MVTIHNHSFAGDLDGRQTGHTPEDERTLKIKPYSNEIVAGWSQS
jgi:hypothetical protein